MTGFIICASKDDRPAPYQFLQSKIYMPLSPQIEQAIKNKNTDEITAETLGNQSNWGEALKLAVDIGSLALVKHLIKESDEDTRQKMIRFGNFGALRNAAGEKELVIYNCLLENMAQKQIAVALSVPISLDPDSPANRTKDIFLEVCYEENLANSGQSQRDDSAKNQIGQLKELRRKLIESFGTQKQEDITPEKAANRVIAGLLMERNLGKEADFFATEYLSYGEGFRTNYKDRSGPTESIIKNNIGQFLQPNITKELPESWKQAAKYEVREFLTKSFPKKRKAENNGEESIATKRQKYTEEFPKEYWDEKYKAEQVEENSQNKDRQSKASEPKPYMAKPKRSESLEKNDDVKPTQQTEITIQNKVGEKKLASDEIRENPQPKTTVNNGRTVPDRRDLASARSQYFNSLFDEAASRSNAKKSDETQKKQNKPNLTIKPSSNNPEKLVGKSNEISK